MRFTTILTIILCITTFVSCKELRSSLLDTGVYKASIRSIKTEKESLLKLGNLRNFNLNSTSKYFRISFTINSEYRLASIEFSQSPDNKITIIYRVTAGDFIAYNNFMFQAKDGVQELLVDSISTETKKQVNELFNYLKSYTPQEANVIGSHYYIAEYLDSECNYYFKSKLYSSNQDINVRYIKFKVMDITREIDLEHKFPNELKHFIDWANY